MLLALVLWVLWWGTAFGAGSCPNSGPLAFAGAEGFGRCTSGGRGGPVIPVSTLEDSGPGSFRQCVEATSGPRQCRLTVSGTASLLDDVTIRHPFVTIEPDPGVQFAIKNGGLVVRASETIIRHLRIRPGAYLWVNKGRNANGITYMSTETGGGTANHLCDHCSVSWGTDDLIAVIFGVDNVTIQDSILSEGLTSGPGCNNCGSRGLLIGNNAKRVSVIRTLNAHNFIRFPNASSGDIDFINNVDYNGNGSSAQIAPVHGPVRINMVGNYWKDGPSTVPANQGYGQIRTIGMMTYSPQSGIYVRDNYGRYYPVGSSSASLLGVASPDDRIIWGDNGGVPKQAMAYPYPGVTSLLTSLQAYDAVLAHSGAQPRDAVDARVVADVRNGTGRIISDPLTVGGWPTLTGGSTPPPTPPTPPSPPPSPPAPPPVSPPAPTMEQRLSALEQRLTAIAREVCALTTRSTLRDALRRAVGGCP